MTLSLGIRWELYPALKLLNNLALEPVMDDLDDPIASLMRQNGTYNVIGTNSGQEGTYYKTKWDDFAPNLGFAWSPAFSGGMGKAVFGSRSVIRGGYSHAFANDSIITSIRNASLGNAGLARTAVTVPNLNQRLSTGPLSLPTAPVFVPPPRTYLQNNSSAFGFYGTIFAIDPNIEAPRTVQYSLGWQREFFGNTAFEVRYVGTRSNNLVRSVDFNQVDIRNNGFAADFNRALNNVRLCDAANTATPNSCATGAGYNPAITGSVQLQVFPLLPSGGLLTNATILGLIRGGTPADLAITYIQNNLNNHPTVASPNLTPFVNFLPNPPLALLTCSTMMQVISTIRFRLKFVVDSQAVFISRQTTRSRRT